MLSARNEVTIIFIFIIIIYNYIANIFFFSNLSHIFFLAPPMQKRNFDRDWLIGVEDILIRKPLGRWTID